MSVRVELLEDGYRLNVGGELSEPVPYGSPVEVELGGKTYLCLADIGDDAGSEVTSVLDSWVYEITPLSDSEVEVVDVDDEDDDDEDEDGDGGDPDTGEEDEDEEVAV